MDTIPASELRPGMTLVEFGTWEGTFAERDRQILRVHGPGDAGLVLVEMEDPSYDGETHCYPASCEVEVR